MSEIKTLKTKIGQVLFFLFVFTNVGALPVVFLGGNDHISKMLIFKIFIYSVIAASIVCIPLGCLFMILQIREWIGKKQEKENRLLDSIPSETINKF